jgi:hypothetical protein
VSGVSADQERATVPTSDTPADQARVEAAVGHPQDKFDALVDRIQRDVVKTFKAVEVDFLDLMWTMDAYRVEQVVPRGMGNPESNPTQRLEGVYRGKGNFFSTVVAQILGQMTTSQLASRSDVMGFSQTHQIDIAWPARDARPLVDPLICCEAKLTGAPPYPGNRGRGAISDWSNRRKELKFQATDLKLYRQAANTNIPNWDRWRRNAPPSVYSLWAARVADRRDFQKMVDEAQILTQTYSDGVGIYAFEPNDAEDGYQPLAVPRGVPQRVTSLDTVLGYISAQIQEIIAANNNEVPAPVQAPTIH